MESSTYRLKAAFFMACLIPLAWLAIQKGFGGLGANPIEKMIRFLGDWSLYLLLGTLALTPMHRLFHLSWPTKIRRMIGLFSFFYVCLHVTGYLAIDQFFDWHEIRRDIIKRPFITVGFVCFLLLIPLAVTSTNKMQRRMRRRWKQLHYFVYPIAIGAVIHFWWMVKKDITRPAFYAMVLALLLGLRIYWALTRIKVGVTETAVHEKAVRRG
ncbi:MAG: sulfoxide reductase heme-binding subunit YedZ [Nitrospirae bacterium]|nr:sulfoxide reductase heme-binding subunit YedZ [Nitrospirota bacterium]